MSAHRRVVINTRERAISTDFNNLQILLAAALANTMYGVAGATDGQFFTNPGARTLGITVANGTLPGDVYAGLLVQPDVAGYLLVSAGVVGFYRAALVTDAEDSGYVLARVDAMTDVSMLTFTANAGPGVRWDLVEVQPTDALITSESRDVYDPGSGLFVPATVEKKRGMLLSYRIRTGVAGAGLPANDANWLPIAAIHVNAGATGFTQCDVYDVRPLVSDRPATMRGGRSIHATQPGVMLLDRQYYVNASSELYGSSLLEVGQFLAGGDLRRNMPCSIANFGVATAGGGSFPGINLMHGDNYETGLVVAANGIYPLMALFPNNLPRWVRFTQTGSPRVLEGSRGLLCMTTNPHDHWNGIGSGITPAAASGLGSCSGVVLGHATFDDAALGWQRTTCVRCEQLVGHDDFTGWGSKYVTLTIDATPQRGYFTLSPRFLYPISARVIRAQLVLSWTVNVVGEGILKICLVDAGETPWAASQKNYWTQRRTTTTAGGGLAANEHVFEIDMPLPATPAWDSNTGSDTSRRVGIHLYGPEAATFTLTDGKLFVNGWRY